MKMPEEYVGREHTWLKHRVLQLYLESWAHKLASVAKHQPVRLWYVDCFAGPWRARGENLEDTSIYIGLQALESAAVTWGKLGYSIRLGAVLVESNQRAFAELEKVLRTRTGRVASHPLFGEFGNQLARIQQLIGSEAAFLFVDPTGWKGAAMRYIAPLVRPPRRDVLINVMFNDINRFKEDPREFLRVQMRDFFGLAQSDLPERLSEADLLAFYRRRLKATCGFEFAADLAVPHPVHRRTKLRLVVGGHDKEVVRLFRDVERRVVGEEASGVRVAAKQRQREAKTSQLTLVPLTVPARDPLYEQLRTEALAEVEVELPKVLRDSGPLEYGSLWPYVLESCHITDSDLRKTVWSMKERGTIEVHVVGVRERSIKDHHIIALPRNRT